MTISTRLIVGISTLAGMAAGFRILRRSRADKHPNGLPEAQGSDEEQEHAAAVFDALQDNATEAPVTG